MHLSALRRKLFVKLLYALLLPNQMLWLHIFMHLGGLKKSDHGERRVPCGWWF
jgi:hypothetical protein